MDSIQLMHHETTHPETGDAKLMCTLLAFKPKENECNVEFLCFRQFKNKQREETNHQ